MKQVLQATSPAGDTHYYTTVQKLVDAIVSERIGQVQRTPGTRNHDLVLLTDNEGHDPGFSQAHLTEVLQELIDSLPTMYGKTPEGHNRLTDASIRAYEETIAGWRSQALIALRGVLPMHME
jgi:hypothetical protein